MQATTGPADAGIPRPPGAAGHTPHAHRGNSVPSAARNTRDTQVRFYPAITPGIGPDPGAITG
ncbi:hypothetical protein GCM10010413_47460 [Promicromonospora sukumoe]